MSAAAVLLACSGGGDAPGAPEDTASPPADDSAAQDLPPASLSPSGPTEPTLQAYELPPGSRPHDVAPAADGGVWYTAQGSGKLGWLDPQTGAIREVQLGSGSRPHGVIVAADGAPWVTDGGQNAIVRLDPLSDSVDVYHLPPEYPNVNLNTAAFDSNGILWFTGQAGYYGRLDPRTSAMQVFKAPRGRGPYGIAATPNGEVYHASLAGSHIAQIDTATGEATVIEPPTPRQGARRVWSDSRGHIWVSEWDAGQVGVYDPETKAWQEWRLPGARPPGLRGLCRRAGQGLANRLRWQRHPPLRSCDRALRDLPASQHPGQRAPAARQRGRGLGSGIRRRPDRRHSLLACDRKAIWPGDT